MTQKLVDCLSIIFLLRGIRRNVTIRNNATKSVHSSSFLIAVNPRKLSGVLRHKNDTAQNVNVLLSRENIDEFSEGWGNPLSVRCIETAHVTSLLVLLLLLLLLVLLLQRQQQQQQQQQQRQQQQQYKQLQQQ